VRAMSAVQRRGRSRGRRPLLPPLLAVLGAAAVDVAGAATLFREEMRSGVDAEDAREARPAKARRGAPAAAGLALLQRFAGKWHGPVPPEYGAQAATMPWDLGRSPVAACRGGTAARSGAAAAGAAERGLDRALDIFCAAGLGALAEFYVDPRFEANDRRLRGGDGWISRAFLTYMGTGASASNVSGEEDMLAQSVHHFSDLPIVVANFGHGVPTSLTPGRFPNMVLMHARGAQTLGKSFNFNKLTAMLFTKIRTGVVLDADQFVNRGIDRMFQRAEEETTAEYPYPIMPAHWMSRDPESSDMAGYPPSYSWRFVSDRAPKQTLRWGHAHPTWTFHALPWLANWTSFALAPERTRPPAWLVQQGHLEDEDLLNIGFWADGAAKQWCKFDIPSPKDFDEYLKQISPSVHLFPDSKYYPRGIALMFFSAHDAKKPAESYTTLLDLWDGAKPLRPIVYDGRWFESGEALRAYDPSLRCLS